MKTEKQTLKSNKRVLVKKCHMCGNIMESTAEISKCTKCNKAFLPLNYFSKIHAKNSKDFKNLFVPVSNLREEDLILGLNILW